MRVNKLIPISVKETISKISMEGHKVGLWLVQKSKMHDRNVGNNWKDSCLGKDGVPTNLFYSNLTDPLLKKETYLLYMPFPSYHLSKAPHDWGSWVNLNNKILCGCCRFPTLSLALFFQIFPITQHIQDLIKTHCNIHSPHSYNKAKRFPNPLISISSYHTQKWDFPPTNSSSFWLV